MASLLAAYSAALSKHPLRTKATTSAVLAVAGELAARRITGRAPSSRSSWAFAVYGLAISGPLPHYFYAALDRLVPARPGKPGSAFVTVVRLLLDRLAFAPVMTTLFFVTTKLLQGESWESVRRFLKAALVPAIKKNWLWWTPAMIVNLNYVPIKFRVLVGSLVAFFWNIYLAVLSSKKRDAAPSSDGGSKRAD